MPRTCIVCNHANRSEIDQLLVKGDSYRNIAKQFSNGESAVFRHNADHLPATHKMLDDCLDDDPKPN